MYIIIQEYFEYLEKGRAHELDVLARKYRAIGPLLTKMEGLVAHTNTGRSPKLQPYYEYWENAVYEALTKVLITLYYSKLNMTFKICTLKQSLMMGIFKHLANQATSFH